LKEIADRLDGKAVQRKEVVVSINVEERREISSIAYLLVDQTKSDDEILREAQVIIEGRRQSQLETVLREVMEKDVEGIAAVWDRAVEAYRGQRRE
jgi:hypothetical protein